MPLEFDAKDREELAYYIDAAFRRMEAPDAASMLAQMMAEAQRDDAPGIAKRLPEIDFKGWLGLDPPPRQSLWGDGWLPWRNTTLLTGAGGIGKSLLAQCLVSSIALNRPFLGMDVQPARCLYLTVEDDAEELWRRQLPICDALGVELSALVDRLWLVSLSGQSDTALAQLNLATGRLETTDRWQELLGTVEQHGIRFIVIDNATDAMAGDHNDLHQVAEFVNQLTGLAMRIDGPVLLLHHPNKANADWLGSIAWHNKVRSRLIIEEGGIEGDPDARVIRNPKANYGPTGGRIAFRWYRGAFVGNDEVPSDYMDQLGEATAAASENRLFLECLRACTDREQAVSLSPSTTFAPLIFAAMPESKGIGKVKLRAAMNRLLSIGAIETGELPWKTRDRHQAKGLRETAGDPAGNPAAETCGQRGQPGSQGAENRAGNAAERYPSPKGEGAAPVGLAAPFEEDWPEWSEDDEPL